MGAMGTVSLGDVTGSGAHGLKRRYAYFAWLCLGSHYLYLGRPIRQLLFWLTLGGLLLWWLADLFRLPAMIAEHNRRSRETLIARYEESLQQRLLHLDRLSRAASMPAPTLPPVQAPPGLSESEPPAHYVAAHAPAPRRSRSTLPAVALTGAIATAIALYIFNPPSLFPDADASFRAMRQVNVRDLPNTASPIRAVAAKETILSGSVVSSLGGDARWLKIGRGSHSGGYVAIRNLETL